ncbi:MAG TPA: 4Fe-4S dicluster domain-containing protein [Spirochaetota bacterium]|nr:4Fe-4S dicluster domain-containing protein [Spirochaetota bacterium]HPI89355.1 4Fe-4S dicluster domain-containing protein [Spirochaetota bacterium]HPR48300.1 4Fe-4S dicluster domain-containing protein [Spirochaetota bacterium]
MSKLGFFERMLLPHYGDTGQITWAEIRVDREKCTGCSLCVRACPADSIMVEDQKARMKPREGNLLGNPGISQCMGCGDCVALCPSGAITLTAPYRWTRFFRTIDRGDPAPPRI